MFHIAGGGGLIEVTWGLTAVPILVCGTLTQAPLPGVASQESSVRPMAWAWSWRRTPWSFLLQILGTSVGVVSGINTS